MKNSNLPKIPLSFYKKNIILINDILVFWFWNPVQTSMDLNHNNQDFSLIKCLNLKSINIIWEFVFYYTQMKFDLKYSIYNEIFTGPSFTIHIKFIKNYMCFILYNIIIQNYNIKIYYNNKTTSIKIISNSAT